MEVTSYKYAFPYLVFLGYFLILMFLEFRRLNKGKSIAIIKLCTLAGFVLFFGLRGFVYTDWYSYYPYFKQLPTLWRPEGMLQVTYEAGFEWYSILIKSIWNNYFFWIFISAIIDACILNSFFKRYSKYYVLGFVVFYIFYGIGIEINLLRNVKAILLFLLSLKYIESRKIIPFILLNLLAVSFHISAVIYLPLYFLLHREYPKQLLWGIFIAGNIIFLLQIEYIGPLLNFLGNSIGGIVSDKVSLYITPEYQQAYGISPGYFERVLTFILLMIYYNKLVADNQRNILFINAYVLYFFFFFLFSEFSVVSERLSLLFAFSYWIIYPNIYDLMISKNNKYFFLIVFIVYSVLKITAGNNKILSKYDNLLWGIESYKNRKETVETVLEIEEEYWK